MWYVFSFVESSRLLFEHEPLGEVWYLHRQYQHAGNKFLWHAGKYVRDETRL
jgi:hypothetical protein